MSAHDPDHGDRVDELLAGCIERPATEWVTGIDAVCRDHPDFASELRRRFDRLIALGIVEPPATDSTGPAPERLGHYRLLRRVGGGGMGVVYEAHDEKLDRRVALKVIRRDQRFFSESRERFAREMHAASRLDHPHLCPIYEAGEVDGVPYIAMRYVEGESLAARLDERRRERAAAGSSTRGSTGSTRNEVVALIEKIARALHAAHEAGIVHRDVKPGNILIDREGEPVLVDFGLAHDTDPERAGLTVTGERLGTPTYMAPEQVSGRGGVDRRTDVYGLGVTLYECLTLHRPFESAAHEDLYRRILTEPPPDPRAFDRGIGAELSVVLWRALEKEKKDRFATAEEFAEELRRVRAHEPIRSRRPSLPLRALRWTQRNPAAAGILAVTLVGLVVSLWLLRQSTRAGTRHLALAWLQVAGQVEDVNPELAFKCARVALRLHDDPTIVARIQEIMFKMREYAPLLRPPGYSRFAVFSPDGRFIAVTGLPDQAALFRRHEDDWRRVPLPDMPHLRINVRPAFSADSHELALVAQDDRVLRFDLRGAAPSPLSPLPPDGARSWSVCYPADPSDDRILVGHEDRARLWNRDGERLADLPRRPESEDWATGAFLPRDRIAAAGRLWSGDGRELAALPRLSGAVRKIAVGEERFFLACEESGDVFAFDFDGERLGATPAISRERDGKFTYVDAELDRTGTRLLVNLNAFRVRLHDAETLELLNEWRTNEGGPSALSPDGERYAAAGTSGWIRIRSLAGEELDVLRGHEAGISSLEWSPDGKELASVDRGGAANVWNLQVRDGVPGYVGHGRSHVAVSPSGESVVFTSETEGVLSLCDASGVRLKRQAVPRGRSHVRFIDDDGTVAVCYRNREEFLVWSARGDGSLRRRTAPFALGFCAPALLPDGRWLLHGPEQGISTWDEDGESTLVASGAQQHFVLSADGTRVLFSGLGGVYLETIDGEELWSKRPLQSKFVGFSRDGREALAASSDGAYLWDLDAPEREATVFRGHRTDLNCAVFSNDGTRVATASFNGAIRFWDRETRRTIVRLSDEGVRRIAFTATGQLVSAGNDGDVRWWWLEVEPLRRAVESLDIGELTDADRERLGRLPGD